MDASGYGSFLFRLGIGELLAVVQAFLQDSGDK